MWAGVGYEDSETISDGGLVNFCIACPQPGINLPENWEDDPET